MERPFGSGITRFLEKLVNHGYDYRMGVFILATQLISSILSYFKKIASKPTTLATHQLDTFSTKKTLWWKDRWRSPLPKGSDLDTGHDNPIHGSSSPSMNFQVVYQLGDVFFLASGVNYFCMFTPWGSDPIWRSYYILFKWVGSTTNQFNIQAKCVENVESSTSTTTRRA